MIPPTFIDRMARASLAAYGLDWDDAEPGQTDLALRSIKAAIDAVPGLAALIEAVLEVEKHETGTLERINALAKRQSACFAFARANGGGE